MQPLLPIPKLMKLIQTNLSIFKHQQQYSHSIFLYLMNKTAKYIFLVISVAQLFGIVIFYSIMASIDPPNPKYNQNVYCPISTYNDLNTVTNSLGYVGQLTFNPNSQTLTYLVSMRASYNAVTQTSELQYCGLARAWYQSDCSNAMIVCSIPGPMFLVNRNQKISIIWVNDIVVTETIKWDAIDCQAEDANCLINMKPKDKPGQCTDIDPTAYSRMYQPFKISKLSVSVSPHIHGLEVRPIFDGNPLSWFTANGEHGPGYFSLIGQKNYFDSFINQLGYSGTINLTGSLIKRSKIIETSNDQLPGILFYHDHAMRSTKYNVQHGLGGIYLIQDKQVESALPQGQNSRMIIFHSGSNANYQDNKIQQLYISPLKLGQPLYILNPKQTYRLGFININFDNKYYNIKVVAYYSDNKLIDPTVAGYDLATNCHEIPFTIIGADSALMHKPIHDEKYFSLGPAERVDLLIRLDQTLPDNVDAVYIICNDFNDNNNIHIKMKFEVSRFLPTGINPLRKTFNYLNVKYFDLKPIVPVVKRHRPIYGYKENIFVIGAHHMFETGASQDPQIGTVQDWHIVNMHIEGHPMHFHLINFQAIKSFSLKKITGKDNVECSLYSIDYFRFSGLPEFTGKTNLQICDYLIDITEEQFHSLYSRLGNYQLENVKYTNANGVNSGLDSMTPNDGNSSYSVPSCSLDSQYKYLCEDTTGNIQEHEKRWKDTALVPQFTVFVLRIRWASTEYDPTVAVYPYFKIPEEHLVQFPGFVYHCHILPHEDNEMMRSIMLRPSEYYLSQYSIGLPSKCNRNNWQESARCINAKFNCV